MKISYDKLIYKSWKVLGKNLILLVPNLTILITSSILLFSMFYIIGIQNIPYSDRYIDFLFQKLLANWYLLLIYGIIMMSFDYFFLGMKFGMIKDVIKHKKTTLKNGLDYGKKYYKRIWGIHFVSFLIVYVPILLGVIISMLVVSKYVLGGIIFSSVMIILTMIYLIYIAYRLIFIYPTMAFHNENVFSSFKDDFHYIKTHIGHTFVSWIVVIAVMAMFISFRTPLQMVSYKNIFLGIISAILIIILELVVSTWEHIFIFESYSSGEKKLK